MCLSQACKGDVVYHCPKGKEAYQHRKGYDLCTECAAAEAQLEFKELSECEGIERDDRCPSRVTLQYYKSTDNGVVNDDIMDAIKELLEQWSAFVQVFWTIQRMRF